MVVQLLGLGSFPDEFGGLNRYFCELFERLREHAVSSRAVTEPAAGTSIAIVITAKVVDWR